MPAACLRDRRTNTETISRLYSSLPRWSLRGVAAVAHERAPVPDHRVGDRRGRRRHQRVARAHQVGADDGPVAGEGADAEVAAGLLDVVEALDLVEIHDGARAGEAELHERDE